MFSTPFQNYYPPLPQPIIYEAFPTPKHPRTRAGPARNRDQGSLVPLTSPGGEDLRLRASFGPLRILDTVSPKEYLVGRDSACDLTLGGKYFDLISMSLVVL